MGIAERLGGIAGRARKLKPVRVVINYSAQRGPILGSGLGYQALFSIFAAVWVLFSIAGLVLAGNTELLDTLIETVTRTVPGLIDPGDGSGAIDARELLEPHTFNVTGLIALAGLLFTALTFLSSARNAVRGIFSLPTLTDNIVLLKLSDLAFLIALAILLVVSTTLSIVGTAATGFALSLLGIDDSSQLAIIGGRIVSLALVILADSVIIAGFLRVLARVRIPIAQLRTGSFIGGTGVAALTVLFQLGIIGGTNSNPLLGSFVVIIGLLVFFNLICQIILISASWVAVSLADSGIPLVPKRTDIPHTARSATTRPRLRLRGSRGAPPA
jgi:membrane protein